jgi:hypothetical protein
MMNRRRATTGALALCGLVAIAGLAATVAAGQKAQGPPVPADVRSVADGGMKAFLQAEGGKGLDRLGFRAAREVANASVGDGLRIYRVDPQRLLDRTDAASFDDVVDKTDRWQMLVMDGTTPKAVVTVDRHEGALAAVSLGAAGLAEQLNTSLGRWPATSYDLRLIVSRQANAELLEVSQRGRVLGVVPLISARVALADGGSFDANELWPVASTIVRMRPLVRQAMANSTGVR